MTAQKGRSLLLKLRTTVSPAAYTSIAAVRTNSITINNNPVDSTTMGDDGIQTMLADAGTQTMTISVDGIYKDAAEEQTIKAAAIDRTEQVFQLNWPNGDTYAGTFVIQDYKSEGPHDGLESFSMTLVRSGAGTFTPAS